MAIGGTVGGGIFAVLGERVAEAGNGASLAFVTTCSLADRVGADGHLPQLLVRSMRGGVPVVFVLGAA